MIRISYKEALEETYLALSKVMDENIAREFAKIFVDNSLEGIYSHGLNRLPRYIDDIKKGLVDPSVTKGELVHEFKAVATLDGKCGIGPLIGDDALRLAESLADSYGIGLVSVKNNSHWLRAGRYVRKLAKDGYIGYVCTNTCMNLAAFKGDSLSLGNNPIGLAIPYRDEVFMFDMALSQYAFGKLEIAAKEGKIFDSIIGKDKNGKETSDPKEILDGGLMFPMAGHKGTALSIMIDMLVTVLTNGRSSYMIGDSPAKEKGVSQIFVAISKNALENYDEALECVDKTVKFYKELGIHIPGENIEKVKEDNLKNGIPVNETTWDTIKALAK